MKQVKYKIIEGYLNPYGSSVDNIVHLVNANLEAGFKLHGNLVNIKDNKYAQAMTYTKKDKK